MIVTEENMKNKWNWNSIRNWERNTNAEKNTHDRTELGRSSIAMCFGRASDWIAVDPNLRTYGVWAYRTIIFVFFGGSAAGAKILICAAREGLPDVPTVRHKADSSYLGHRCRYPPISRKIWGGAVPPHGLEIWGGENDSPPIV